MIRDAEWKRLAAGKIIEVTEEDWQESAGRLRVLETHDTGISGKLLLTRGPTGLVAVEQPKPGLRVLRPIPDRRDAQRFVRERLETYDRMWDGCGCKIDYYH